MLPIPLYQIKTLQKLKKDRRCVAVQGWRLVWERQQLHNIRAWSVICQRLFFTCLILLPFYRLMQPREAVLGNLTKYGKFLFQIVRRQLF